MGTHIKTTERHYTAIRLLVHWPLMGGLGHLVQRKAAWAGFGRAQFPPRFTKCNGRLQPTHQRPVYKLRIIKPQLAIARLRLHASMMSICLSVCLSVCLSPKCKILDLDAKMQKRNFLKT